MHKEIIQRAIKNMSSDANIIRLSFLTSFFHSMVVALLVLLNANKFLMTKFENGLYIGKIAEFLIQEINKNHVTARAMWIILVLYVLYSFMHPIGHAAIIHYLHEKKSIRQSLKSVLKSFFSMFEYGFVCMIFSPIALFIMIYKVVLLDWKFSLNLILLFSAWSLLVITVNTFKVYTRYFIVLQQKWVYEAIKASFKKVWSHFGQTRKYMKMQTLLLINFSLNMILVIWLPVLLIYAAISRGIIDLRWIKMMVYVMFFILLLFGAYISSFIRAFFAYYRYESYQKLEK